MEPIDRFIIGKSEDMEAEYAHAADWAPVTLLHMIDGEPIAIEGFNTIEAARNDLDKNGIAPGMIEYVG